MAGKKFETFAVFKQDLFYSMGHFVNYDILEWELLKIKLNLRKGEIVKITIEKLKEI